MCIRDRSNTAVAAISPTPYVIPDLYRPHPRPLRVGPPHTLWEVKCWTPYKPGGSLGRGSSRWGGAASTTDGYLVAFGNTEELLRPQGAIVCFIRKYAEPLGALLRAF
eukprot:4564466-Prymnesium_polylepis.1